MNEEEVVLLEEQLASAHADIERLTARLADADAMAKGHQADTTELRRQLDAARDQIGEREGVAQSQAGQIEALQAILEELHGRSQGDAARYRALVLAHEPDLPADLVAGDSIEAVDESLAQARQTVAQVRQHIEQQAQALRVPAGAPVRAAPDTSDLSPAEKIRLGLSNK
jgi:chromosome segregation ATPase